MSLQVWLPLTKDLRQQGLSNMTVENHNATLNTAGKLGSCYYFNGSQQWLQLSNNLGNFYNNDWSIACWLKPTDSTRSIILSEYSGTGASNVAIELTTARVVRLYWNGSPDINFSTAGALPLDEWTHLAITKQERIIKLYFNGELNGKGIKYNGKGEIVFEGEYKNNYRINGIKREYFYEGNLKLEEEINDGSTNVLYGAERKGSVLWL